MSVKYELMFNSNGDIEVCDASKNIVPGKPAEFPEKASQIYGVKTITIVEAEGSHYIIVYVNGVPKKYYLPH
jgi:hypothetical protein